jgi:predicted secreted hydrolase
MRSRGVARCWRVGWLRRVLAGAAGMLVALLVSVIARAAGPLPAVGAGVEGFAQVLGPRTFEFPRDHGAHPEYRQEWWYFTGNLDSPDGERFGFELTFFRFGLAPGEVGAGSGTQSTWRARQMYMAHFAVTDVGRQRFRFAEKVSRGGAIGLAGARHPPLKVWVDDWVLEDSGDASAGHWKLHAAEQGYELTLDVDGLLAPVLNGDHGFSAKSDAPGSASYYYSIPRVAVHGQLRRDGKALEVRGLAWMDREWGSGSLSKEQQGWDWFALQTRDGGSLMFYALRDHDGRRDSHSAGTWVSAVGEARPLKADDVQIEVLDYWRNPRGERYPAKWHVRVPAVGVDVEVRPVLADQELITGSSRYWEGAVDLVEAGESGAAVRDDGGDRREAVKQSAGDALATQAAGRGYVELVGYGAQ